MTPFTNLARKVRRRIDETACLHANKQRRDLPSGRYVSLCFDDFPQSSAINAAPLIESFAARATWYVSGALEGTHSEHFGPMFESRDLRQLIGKGHDIGGHTFDHVDCSRTSEVEIRAQCARNQAFLKAHGAAQVRSFAYPYGNVDLTAKRALVASGMALRAISAGTNRESADLGMLKACGLQDDQGGVRRALKELASLKRSDGWLIIFTHDVRPDPSLWGVTPEVYQHLLQAVAASGAEIVTVAEMLGRLSSHSERSDRMAA